MSDDKALIEAATKRLVSGGPYRINLGCIKGVDQSFLIAGEFKQILEMLGVEVSYAPTMDIRWPRPPSLIRFLWLRRKYPRHWLWGALSRISLGETETDVMAEYGYVKGETKRYLVRGLYETTAICTCGHVTPCGVTEDPLPEETAMQIAATNICSKCGQGLSGAKVNERFIPLAQIPAHR